MAELPPNIPSGAVPPPPKKETGKVQPKKETVRISLPPKPSAAPTIKLPTLPPGGPTGAPSAPSAAAPVSVPHAPRPTAAAPPAPPSGAPQTRIANAPQPRTGVPRPARPPPRPAPPSRRWTRCLFIPWWFSSWPPWASSPGDSWPQKTSSKIPPPDLIWRPL